ncbi:MAG: rhodanese-like domain-containing protein [Patescibacteria group bacterium]|nr:rhodanese-like domain-containing protein [Patescibacteria group bacterium]MDE1966216.1 rhodanese-like domain-containing protein [Patescibacteria group bacterium]
MFGYSPIPEVSVTEAAARIGADGHVLVDVRSPEEVAMLGIEGARNVPLELIAQAADELAGFDSVHVVCRSGSRSGAAVQMLHARGVRHAKNVAGGLIAWEAAGLPTRIP